MFLWVPDASFVHGQRNLTFSTWWSINGIKVELKLSFVFNPINKNIYILVEVSFLRFPK